MAQPAWLKKYLRLKPEVEQIFNDLEEYEVFCRDFGRVFDQSEMYENRSINWQDFMKHKSGRHCRNEWGEELKRMHRAANGFGYNNNRGHNNNHGNRRYH